MTKNFTLLYDHIKRIGNIFFRWRSYIPLILIIILLLKQEKLKFAFDNHIIEFSYQLICLFISFFGEFVRIITIGYVPSGTSGRNTKAQRATELNTTGTYSIMRNPLYMGNYLIILGISLFSRSWEIVILNSLLFAIFYVPIILVEEDFLLGKFGDSYREYVSKTPCFFPRFSLWNSAKSKLNWGMVIRREHNSILAIGLSFTLIAYFRLYTINGKFILNIFWLFFIGILMFIWLVARLFRIFGKR